MEKEEADAAAARLVKEKGQFEHALEVYHDEQQKLRQEIASAEVPPPRVVIVYSISSMCVSSFFANSPYRMTGATLPCAGL